MDNRHQAIVVVEALLLDPLTLGTAAVGIQTLAEQFC